MSTKAERKAEGERTVFALFAQAMNWPSDERLIQSRQEPEPDILYDSANGKTAFELVENCSDVVAHNIRQLLDGKGKTVINVSDPTRDVIKKKIGKKYESHYPIELLCYTNGRIVTPNDVAICRIRTLLQSSRRVPFRRLWYFGKNNFVELVWERLTDIDP